MAQLGVIELVVKDEVRVQKAKHLYQEVELAFLTAEARRLAASQVALAMSGEGEPTDDEIRQAFEMMETASREAFERYIALQLELRKVLTKSEFDQLTKVR